MMTSSAQSVAKIILEGFDKHYLAFRTNSQRAKSKFENSEYSGIRELLSERISFYDSSSKGNVKCSRYQIWEENKGELVLA